MPKPLQLPGGRSTRTSASHSINNIVIKLCMMMMRYDDSLVLITCPCMLAKSVIQSVLSLAPEAR